VTGLVGQVVLLAALAVTLGLSTEGLLAGAVYGVVLCGLLGAGLVRARMATLGWANGVTLSRAVLVGGVTALVVTSFTHPVNTPALVALAGVALALDGVDGQVARRTGTTTALGARFDMEIDAFLILVLSVYAGDRFGWWTVALGAYRYLFVAASWAAPWLTGSLPPKFSRKVVAALQGVVLALVTAHLLPSALALTALAVALVALTWSFGRDIAWLHRAAQVREAARERWSVPAQSVPAQSVPAQSVPAQAVLVS
jgi:phosphatidylglycerophosphate synthase